MSRRPVVGLALGSVLGLGLVLVLPACPAAPPLQVPPSESASLGGPVSPEHGGGPAVAGRPGAGPARGDAGSVDAPPAVQALGQPCTVGSECQSGVCEGQGCTGRSGSCVQASRSCHGSEQPFCSCAGVTFRAPADCPGQTYARLGACTRAGGASSAP